MDFIGMEPFELEFPNSLIRLSGSDQAYDVHNEAVIAGFEYDYGRKEAMFRWRLKPDLFPDQELRSSALLVLRISGVLAIVARGELDSSSVGHPLGLDFIEYRQSAPEKGVLRFVLDNEAEIAITGLCCEARLIAASNR